MAGDFKITNGQIRRRLPDGSLVWVEIDPGPELTEMGTIYSKMGRPRKRLLEGGIHLLFYPKFKRWIHNPPTHLHRWDAIHDRRRYFINLAALTVLEPIEADGGPLPDITRLRAFCMSTDPTLTTVAMEKILRPTLALLSIDQYRLATANPAQSSKLTPEERAARKRFRQFVDIFAEDTQPQDP